jgi:antitoxin (DNA-binding transcriptional repressor) of toxin-antitoxin stability system
VLARAAERRAWLSRPLGQAPHYSGLNATAARALVSSLLDRDPAGGWLSLSDAEAPLATHGIPVAPLIAAAIWRARSRQRRKSAARSR